MLILVMYRLYDITRKRICALLEKKESNFGVISSLLLALCMPDKMRLERELCFAECLRKLPWQWHVILVQLRAFLTTLKLLTAAQRHALAFLTQSWRQVAWRGRQRQHPLQFLVQNSLARDHRGIQTSLRPAATLALLSRAWFALSLWDPSRQLCHS